MQWKLVALLAVLSSSTSPVAAQLTRTLDMGNRRGGSCGDSTSAMYHTRLRMDLEYIGDDQREVKNAFFVATVHVPGCVMYDDQRPVVDTSVYARFRITHTEQGAYVFATELAGPLAPRDTCRNARAASMAPNQPIVLGVMLGAAVRSLAECAEAARAAASTRK